MIDNFKFVTEEEAEEIKAKAEQRRIDQAKLAAEAAQSGIHWPLHMFDPYEMYGDIYSGDEDEDDEMMGMF